MSIDVSQLSNNFGCRASGGQIGTDIAFRRNDTSTKETIYNNQRILIFNMHKKSETKARI